MQNAITLAHVMGPVYLLIGLSVLVYLKSWHKVIEKYENDHLAIHPFMLMYAILGAIVINMYNVWAWNVWLLVTLTVWLLAVKSVFYFLMPESVIKTALALQKKKRVLILAGIMELVFGGVLTYYSYFV
jgi:hypothetical protein